MDKQKTAVGTVVQAFGNLLHVRFEGSIRQGEVARVEVGGESLLSEVIEIAGTEAKIQVFEDTRGIKLNTPVRFTGHLLEAELGPGLLTSIVDGLQKTGPGGAEGLAHADGGESRRSALPRRCPGDSPGRAVSAPDHGSLLLLRQSKNHLRRQSGRLYGRPHGRARRR